MNDQFELYKKELGRPRYAPITQPGVERGYLQRLRDNPNDDQAFHALVNSNLRFVMYIIKEFNIPLAIDIMDIIQWGNYGLMVGIRRFRVDKYPDVKLRTFAVSWIRLGIRTALEKNKIYERNHVLFAQVNNGFESDTPDTSGEAFAFPAPVDSEASETTGDTTGLADICCFLERYLDARSATIVRLYFGLGADSQPKTLDAIGQQLHINVMRVKQLRDRALAKLQNLIPQAFDEVF